MRTFDANSFEDNEREELKPGEYIAMIVDDDETGFVNRQIGTKGDYLSLTYKILSPEPFQGLRVWDNQSLAENALYMLSRLYKAIEPDAASRTPFNLDSDDEIHNALFYKPLRIVVGVERREGYKDRFRPKKFKPVIGEEFDQMMDLAQTLLNTKSEEWGKGPRIAPENAGTTFELQGEDSDIPF